MNLATIILTHSNPELTADTVRSVQTWVGERVLVLADQAGWDKFKNFKTAKAEVGFHHAHNRSPYRNYALGLKKLYQYYPDSDWFLYTEYDTLFTSNNFLEDLERAQERNAWMVGADLRRFDFSFPLLEKILKQGKIQSSYYFLGCCHFLHRKFVAKLHEIGFLDRLLEETKSFEKGFFPDYNRWAFEEELWPTLVAHLGGALYELVCWKNGSEWQTTKSSDPNMFYAGQDHGQWRGRFKKYPIRNSPNVMTMEMKPEACIVHPIKDLNDPIRIHQREKRKKKNILFN